MAPAPDDQQRPLLRDVIRIKESISTSDFVLQLAEATTPAGAERALKDYVVTERLLENFDDALGLIKAAVDGGTSKAAYLHGSFGAGKSHFMAVLHALLSNSTAARGRAEFDSTLSKHSWLGADGKRFLLVPYHMLGAKAIEQRVLGGYVTYVKKNHPTAPTPQVYRTDALFADIRSMRERLGVDAVIRGLTAIDGDGGSGSDDEDEWGESFSWTPELLETALDAEEVHESGRALNLVSPSAPAELRARLVQDASANLLPGFARNAAEDEHGFISLDAGLSVIAEHAKSIGYDGLILFLDELILWLATLIHDQRFVAREAGKITNLVEGGDARRAVPIVSFIARQRDLRELVGDELSGAAEASIQDTLNLASGRFETITLEDRNLPQVANARLLQPHSPETAALIRAEFDKTRKVRQEVWDTLLGSDKGTTGADEDSFRLSYPFSPAFMDTLVHVSSALQRNRTGMKLMGQLLADHRDELRLGDLIPVGDLYPLITAGGDKPFTDSLKVVFDAADKLYRNKLRPHLLLTYDLTEEDVEQYTKHGPDAIADPELRNRVKLFVGDNRIVGTILLSALAPSVPALKDLTIRRLSALNYGSIVAPIPGREYGILKNKIDEWAGHFPEIKPTGTEANPGVRLELSGVDVDSVIANANVNDNPGNRIALAKRLLAEEFGVQQGKFADEFSFVWRGTARTCEVAFGSVADRDEMPDHDLFPQQEGHWRIAVGLPFSENERGAVDGANRIRTLREQQQGERSRTVAWLPAHLSAQRHADFRRLVVIDKALADPQRFDSQYAGHLNSDNRSRAKGLLQSQREALLKNIRTAFKQAYGLAHKKDGDVTMGFADHLESLPDVAGLNLGFGQSLHDGVRHVAGKLLAQQFPAHPDLDPDATGGAVKPSDARKVFAHVRAAAESRDGRVEVPRGDRDLMTQLAGPLQLGQQKEAYFELSPYWPEHFRQLARAKGQSGDLSVIALTDWTDLPEPRGLPEFLTRLVIASFAEMDDRVWVAGGPIDPAPELAQIKDHFALRSQSLPSREDWDAARDRFERIFGEKPQALLRSRIVNHFAGQIAAQTRAYKDHAAKLVSLLEENAAFLGLDQEAGEGGRLALAHRSQELLRTVEQAASQGASGAKKTVEALARFDLGEVSADRYGTSVTTAAAVAAALAGASWETLALAAAEGVEGRALLDALRGTARSDQRTADLGTALARTQRDVVALVRRNREAAAPPSPPAPDPRAGDVSLTTPSSHPTVTDTPQERRPTSGGRARRSGGARTTVARAVAELQADLEELARSEPGATIEITWQVVDR